MPRTAEGMPVMNKRHVVAYSLFLLAVVVVLYSGSVDGEFVWDDVELIVRDPKIQAGTDFTQIITHPFGRNAHRDDALFYRPVTTLSYFLNHRLGGGRPVSFRLVNIVLHALVSIEVFLLILVLFRNSGIAIAASLLFAVHPAHVPSVAWISGRTDLLCALFLLGAVLSYVIARADPSRPKLKLLSYACLVLAMGSKEVGVFLVLCIVLVDFCREEWSWRRVLGKADKVYYSVIMALTVAFVIVRSLIVTKPGPVTSLSEVASRCLDAPARLVVYLRSLCIPWNLSGIHFLPEEASPWFLAIGCLAIVATVLGLIWCRREAAILLGACWFVIFLLPALILAPVNMYAASDHLLYLPSVGWSLSMAGLLALMVRDVPRPRLATRMAGGVLAVVCAVCSVECVRAAAAWRSDPALWRNMVQRFPKHPYPWSRLGSLLREKGDLAEAERTYRTGLSHHPSRWNLWFGLAEVAILRRDYDTAERHLNEAMRRESGHAEIHNNLGNIYYLRKDYARAVHAYKQALSLDRRDYKAMYNLGMVLELSGDLTAARPYYRMFLEGAPAQFEAQKQSLRARLD